MSTSLRRLTAFLLVLMPLWIGFACWIISRMFDGYPAFFGGSGAEILESVTSRGSVLRTANFLLMASFILCIPLTVLTGVWAMRRSLVAGLLINTCGTGASLFAALGVSIWVFFVPALMGMDMEQTLRVQLFELVHGFVGLGVGRFFVCVFAAGFLVAVTLALKKSDHWWGQIARIIALWLAVVGAAPLPIVSSHGFAYFALMLFAGQLMALGVIIWRDHDIYD